MRTDETYRGQFIGRLGTQLATGTQLGSSMLLLVMNGQLSASGGFIADQGIRVMETILYQGLQFWRSNVADSAFGASTQRPTRDRYAAMLMLSWGGEVAVAGATLGLLAVRGAAWLTTRRLVMLLGIVRLARIIVSQLQYAQFDGLRGRLPTPQAQRMLETHREFLRTADQSAGFMVNILAATLMQALPYMVPAPALAGVMIGLSLSSVALGLLSKKPMWPYLDEGIGRPVGTISERPRRKAATSPAEKKPEERRPPGLSPGQDGSPRRSASGPRASVRYAASGRATEGNSLATSPAGTDSESEAQSPLTQRLRARFAQKSPPRAPSMRRAFTDAQLHGNTGSDTPRFLS